MSDVFETAQKKPAGGAGQLDRLPPGESGQIKTMKNEHPFLFSEPMILSLLDGTKTQTRCLTTRGRPTRWCGYTHSANFNRSKQNKKNQQTTMSTEIQTTQAEKPMEFIPFGAADKIRLTVKIIQNIVAVPTKSGKTCSERDAMKFMMLCQAQRLNPFAGDAFLIGYDGQSGATFSLITAHQAMLKRAEANKDFDGMTSGILLVNESREVVEREGDFHLSEETEMVVGGWAKVYHKQRQHPTYRRIRMARFNKGFAQWKEDAAGMIVKCAEADALRSTFPTLLGGLYISEERGLATSVAEVVAARSFDAPPTDMAPLTSDENTPPDFKPLPTPQVETGSPHDKLAAMVEGAGYDYALFVRWAEESGNIPDATSLPRWQDITKADAVRLLKSKTGLLAGLKLLKDDLTA